MSTSRLSTKGQLVIPAEFRKALNLKAGDRIEMKLHGQNLVLTAVPSHRARLKRAKSGRLVLVAPKGAPAMTTESVIAMLEELP